MKKLILSLILGLTLGLNALAYVSNQGTDPVAGQYETEYKSAQKSETASYSDAISKGHALFYDENSTYTGLYRVSRYHSATYNTAASTKFHACIASRAVATGDTTLFPCVTRGFVNYARYIAGLAGSGNNITAGDYLCIGTAASNKGQLLPCAANITSPFISLESKTSSGTDLKVLVKSD